MTIASLPAALTDGSEDVVARQVVQLLGLAPAEADRPGLAARLRPLERSDALGPCFFSPHVCGLMAEYEPK